MNMGSNLIETLLPMGSGVLCITCDNRGEDYEPARDPRWSYARFERFDRSSASDRMECLSMATLPNVQLASRLRETSRGQRDVARGETGRRTREHYENNAALYLWQAEHVLQVSVEMPSKVVALDDRRVVAAFRNGAKDVKFRVVDVESGEVEHETDGNVLARHFGGPAQFQRSQEEIDALEEIRDELGEHAAHLPRVRGALPVKAKLVAGGQGQILVTLAAKEARGYVVFAYSAREFLPVRDLAIDHYGWRVGAIAEEHFIVCGNAVPGMNPRVAIIDRGSERMRSTEVDRDAEPIEAIAAVRAPIAWLPQFGGFALRANMATGVVERVKVRTGMNESESMRMAVAPDGTRLLVSVAHEPDRPLVLTDLARTEAFVLPDEEAWHVSGQPGEYALLRRSPGFAFIGDEPQVLCSGVRKGACDLPRYVEPKPEVTRTEAARLPPELVSRVAGSTLQARLGDVDDIYSPGLSFVARRQPGTRFALGATRIGGLPDLGHGAEWPRHQGLPMAFLAQFNLADIKRESPRNRLPPFGLLSFFRAVDPEYGGAMWYDQESRAKAGLVLFAPDLDELERATQPLHPQARGEHFVAPACALSFTSARPLPDLDSLQLSRRALTESEREEYLALSSPLVPENELAHGRHQLLGYRDYGNHWYEVPAERMANGLPQFGQIDDKSDVGKALIRAAGDWIPLVEFASCQVSDWMWGDGGSLLWLIRAQDLDQLRFDRSVAVTCR